MANITNHTVHSGAEHQGITLKGVNTNARPYKGSWATPGTIKKAPDYVDPGSKAKPYVQPKATGTPPPAPAVYGKTYLA